MTKIEVTITGAEGVQLYRTGMISKARLETVIRRQGKIGQILLRNVGRELQPGHQMHVRCMDYAAWAAALGMAI